MEELTGKPIEIEAGKTYVIELETRQTREQIYVMSKLWEEATGAKVVFIDGGKIARDSEQDIRERIAEEIFSLKTDQGRKTPWNPLTPEGEKLAWGAGYAAARNQAGFIARGKNDD